MWAAGCWLVGTKLLNTPETRADWGELARGTGFAQTPGLLSVLVFIPYAGGVIAAIIFVWRFVAMLRAVQASLDYSSMWRAFFVVLIAFIPVLIVAGIVFAIMASLGIEEAEHSAWVLPGIFNIIGV